MIETNKLEDTENNFPYDDILYLEHPTSRKHPRMFKESRAGQFSPYAALTGYDEQVKEVSRYVPKKIELSEGEKEKLDEVLQIIKKIKEPLIKITYFIKDKRKTGGIYQEIISNFKKADYYHNAIVLKDKVIIPIEDIVKIEIINTQE